MKAHWRYPLAVVLTGVGVGLTLAFYPLIEPMRLIFLWVAVLGTAIVGGTGPGLLATALSTVAAGLLLFEPVGEPRLVSPMDFVRLLIFASFAGSICVAVGMRRSAEERARRIAAENARLLELAEAANRAKDEFLATLSHELRTPVTAIAGWAHILKTGASDPETTQLAVETIIRSAKAQGELIDDLLDFSSITSGTFRLRVGPVDIARVVREVLDAALPAIEGKELVLALRASAPVVVRGDERRLRQVVWNLVSNAVKFSERGGSLRVTVTATPRSGAVVVEDEGHGIDPAFLPHVWERFRQADSTASRRHGGLGLGLSVVRQLVEIHGGTVEAKSDGLGNGATFRVEIPLAQAGSDQAG